jgi:hypothetical protein
MIDNIQKQEQRLKKERRKDDRARNWQYKNKINQGVREDRQTEKQKE